MDLELSDEQAELRDNFRSVLEDCCPPALVRAIYEDGEDGEALSGDYPPEHRKHRISLREVPRREQGVRWQWSAKLLARCAQLVAHGADHLQLFTTQMPTFPSVRIEPSNQYPRLLHPELVAQPSKQQR